MQMTITEAAKLYRKQRKTLYRHIDAGRLSCSVRGDGHRVLDLSELIRCYGDPPGAGDSPATRHGSEGDSLLTHALLDEIRRQTAVIEQMSQRVERLESAMLRLPAPRVDEVDRVDSTRERPEQPSESRQADTLPDDTHADLRALVDALRRQE